MDIIIDNSASLPIYEQLRNQIRDQIINDVLAYDEKLPSIRVLAKDLSISIMIFCRREKRKCGPGNCAKAD